ncbi:DUF4293 domain-containing protein [Hymenobacter sp. BT175]|uniref:DUF4293 domain-containing protein n=1 Tax=Hymenobacter translucens TaxID=2886507 RepID=UPI001D0F2688|nr:DUF4293 domain-containing protein [Hymenobacter translucens]MCC2545795.1 DUF4293 domain-containing protein [Hymenobacter translucens]
MIQRIQSVFLLLLALAMISVAFLPIWSKLDPLTGEHLHLTAFQLLRGTGTAAGQQVQLTWPIGALAIASSLVALYEIFQFRNRFLQLKLGLVNLFLIVATLGSSFYYSNLAEPMLNIKVPGEFEAGFYLPTLALLLNVLANRFIRRDEQLVRSMDRLR